MQNYPYGQQPQHQQQQQQQQPHAQQQQHPQQQPAQQQMQSPALGFGLGAGGVRLNYKGGAFTPSNIYAAAVSGKGFQRPRLFGLGLLGLSALFTVGNYVLVMVLNRFYPYLYSLAAIFACSALWLLITGQPLAQEDGSDAPGWGRYGLIACAVIGTLLGIAMISVSWEHLL